MITKTMTIEAVFEAYPEHGGELAHTLTQYGLHCMGCSAAAWETLEAGVLSHGMDEESVDQLVAALNQVVAQELDYSSITLTKRAAEKFRELGANEGKAGWALRFGDKAAGCSGFEYILDFSKAPTKTDAIFTSEGVEIHVDEALLPRLMGCRIDYKDGLNTSGFKISNPNSRASCSCGASHSYGKQK
jgi:iron-sulfur cluster assembly accessory protein